jgi:hypothetical protein
LINSRLPEQTDQLKPAGRIFSLPKIEINSTMSDLFLSKELKSIEMLNASAWG